MRPRANFHESLYYKKTGSMISAWDTFIHIMVEFIPWQKQQFIPICATSLEYLLTVSSFFHYSSFLTSWPSLFKYKLQLFCLFLWDSILLIMGN